MNSTQKTLEILHESVNEEKQNKNIHEIRALASLLHQHFCHEDSLTNFKGCPWNNENWLSLEINHHRAEFYDKAEKIYNFFDQNALVSNKVVQFILTSPAARQFFDGLI